MAKSDMNVIAAQGFEQAATVYEEARPTYPNEAIDFIKSLYNKPDIIIDLGAGTGKLTRLLGSLDAREIIAIEPVAAMRENLKNIPIITKIIDGTAENIPVEDNTIDMILCGQSFHWFANHRALTEFNRVLKSNGLLVLLWNSNDSSGRDWEENISQLVQSFRAKAAPRYTEMGWKEVFDNQNLFSSLEHKVFSNTIRITRDLALKRILSTSFIAVLPSEQKEKLIDDIQKILANAEETRDLQEFDANYVTNVYWCSTLKSSS